MADESDKNERKTMHKFPPPHPIHPPVVHYGPQPIPLRPEPHIPLTRKTGASREQLAAETAARIAGDEQNAEAIQTAANAALEVANAKYSKPSGGIPKSDLASSVQASLSKADSALQQHQDISGKADLVGGKVPSSQLPSYVDDVLEFDSFSVFPTGGESGKIYVAKDENKTYRWTGTQYVQIGGGEIPVPSDSTPKGPSANGDSGTALTVSRSDHVHPFGSRISIGNAELSVLDGGVATISTIASNNKLQWPVLYISAGSSISDQDGHEHSWDVDTVYDFNEGSNYTNGTKPAKCLPMGGSVNANICFTQSDDFYLLSIGNLSVSCSAHLAENGTDLILPLTEAYEHTGSFYLTYADYSSVNRVATLNDIPTVPTLATVATTGSYNDLTNKPTIPAAQVNADWNASSGVAQILNKPTIPTVPTNVSAFTNDAGYLTSHQSLANYVQKSQTAGLLKNDGTVDTNTYLTQHQDISGKANSASLAAAYDPEKSSAYAIGDYCTHDGLLYRCTTATANPPSAWNAANWTAVAVTDEMGADTPLPFDAECEYVTVPAGAYIDPDVIAYDASLGIEATFRIPSSPTPGEGSFRCGIWDSNTSTFFQLYINDSSNLKLFRYAQSFSSVSNSPFVGSFGTASAIGSTFSNGTNKMGVSSDGNQHTPFPFLICALASNSTPGTCVNPVDIAAFKFSFSGVSFRALVPVRIGTVGYLYDKISGRLFGSAVGSIPLVPGPDKATPTITKPDRLVEINERNNYLAYASTTTLAPETAVYRSALNADGTFPTITATGIPTAAAYYQFELELSVPSAVPSTITGPSGWTWLDGHGLPDPADLVGGETICISVRFDCTARTFLASVWRVA